MRSSPALLVVVVVLGLPSAVFAAPAPPPTTYGPESFANPSAVHGCGGSWRSLGSATTTQTGEIRASLQNWPTYTTDETCNAYGDIEVTYTVGPRVRELPVEVTVHYGQRPDSTRFTSEDMGEGDSVYLRLNTFAQGQAPNGQTFSDSRFSELTWPDYQSGWGVFCNPYSSDHDCEQPMPEEIVFEGTDVRTQSVFRPSDHAEPGVSYLPEGKWKIRVGTGMAFRLYHDLRHASHATVKLGAELRADIKQIRVGG